LLKSAYDILFGNSVEGNVVIRFSLFCQKLGKKEEAVLKKTGGYHGVEGIKGAVLDAVLDGFTYNFQKKVPGAAMHMCVEILPGLGIVHMGIHETGGDFSIFIQVIDHGPEKRLQLFCRRE
jgi:hypothetical protein